jgi:predicted transcriptional regulator
MELTHQQLANRSGVNRSSIAGVEAGTRDVSFSTLVRLREALHAATWDELLDPQIP